jgi:hypothetical protein
MPMLLSVLPLPSVKGPIDILKLAHIMRFSSLNLPHIGIPIGILDPCLSVLKVIEEVSLIHIPICVSFNPKSFPHVLLPLSRVVQAINESPDALPVSLPPFPVSLVDRPVSKDHPSLAMVEPVEELPFVDAVLILHLHPITFLLFPLVHLPFIVKDPTRSGVRWHEMKTFSLFLAWIILALVEPSGQGFLRRLVSNSYRRVLCHFSLLQYHSSSRSIPKFHLKLLAL